MYKTTKPRQRQEIPTTIIPQNNQTVNAIPENAKGPTDKVSNLVAANRTSEQDSENMTGTSDVTGDPTFYQGEDFFCYAFGNDGICNPSEIMNPSNKSSLPGIPTSPYVGQSQDRAVENTTSAGIEGFVPYENPIYGFRMQYPSNWEKLELNKRTTPEGTTNLIVSFRGQGVRFDITTLDKQYTNIDEVFGERLQMYKESGYSISNSRITPLGMGSYPAYTIRADYEGCCIITEYGMIPNNHVYLLSWEYYPSNPSDYGQRRRFQK